MLYLTCLGQDELHETYTASQHFLPAQILRLGKVDNYNAGIVFKIGTMEKSTARLESWRPGRSHGD